MKEKIVHQSEKFIYFILTVILLLFVVFQIVELIIQFYNAIVVYDFVAPNIAENKVFSNVAYFFFNILISIEILETFKEHKNDVLNKTKIIILIAITAMTRKIITIDIKHLDYLTDIGIAVLMLGLSVGYYFISKSNENEEKRI